MDTPGCPGTLIIPDLLITYFMSLARDGLRHYLLYSVFTCPSLRAESSRSSRIPSRRPDDLKKPVDSHGLSSRDN